jgi:hypothetical protein
VGPCHPRPVRTVHSQAHGRCRQNLRRRANRGSASMSACEWPMAVCCLCSTTGGTPSTLSQPKQFEPLESIRSNVYTSQCSSYVYGLRVDPLKAYVRTYIHFSALVTYIHLSALVTYVVYTSQCSCYVYTSQCSCYVYGLRVDRTSSLCRYH